MSTSGSTWYYADAGERIGPRTLDEMRTLAADGLLTPATLVWTPGLAEWLPAERLPLLFESPAPPVEAPPPVPEAAPATRALPPAAHAWSRFLARTLDLAFFTLVAVAAALLDPAAVQPGTPNYALLLIPALWVPVEAVLLAVTGTTPGKTLFSLRVETADGDRPPLARALNRAARVWVLGFGLGLPVVNQVAQAIGYTRVTRTGSTAWDDALHLRVVQGTIGPWRTLGIATLIVLMALAIGNVVRMAAAG